MFRNNQHGISISKILIVVIISFLFLVVLDEDVKGEDKEPEWKYYTNSGVGDLDISYDGSYIITSTGNTYLFGNTNNTPIWTSEDGGGPVSISSDGKNMVSSAGKNIYFFRTPDNFPGIRIKDRNPFNIVIKELYPDTFFHKSGAQFKRIASYSESGSLKINVISPVP